MLNILVYLLAFIAIATLVYMLIKKIDIKITLFVIGLCLMYVAILMGKDISFRGFKSTGWSLFDPISVIPAQFVSTLSRAGLIILILSGYAAYMNKIRANESTVHLLLKPLKGIKSPYVLVPIVFLIGNFLSLVVPSASNLAIILLATLYPVLRKAGMTTLTAAGIIATTATIMPTPLGGDNVAITTELNNFTGFSDLTVSDYVFRYHAIVSIPTLLLMAIVHFFWQKHMDKRDIGKNLPQDDFEMSSSGDQENKIDATYAVLPLLPIIVLLVFYFLGVTGIKTIAVDVGLATFISFFITIIVELVRHKDKKTVLENTGEFFTGMGHAMSVVALLVAASIFVVGLKSIGLISSLQTLMQSADTSGIILPLILVIFTGIIVTLSGSGVALFYAMVPLMVPLAEAASISPLAVTLPMGLAGNLFRACSPVAAVIVIIAGSTKQNPFSIVKRTLVPSLAAVLFMFILAMILYL